MFHGISSLCSELGLWPEPGPPEPGRSLYHNNIHCVSFIMPHKGIMERSVHVCRSAGHCSGCAACRSFLTLFRFFKQQTDQTGFSEYQIADKLLSMPPRRWYNQGVVRSRGGIRHLLITLTNFGSTINFENAPPDNLQTSVRVSASAPRAWSGLYQLGPEASPVGVGQAHFSDQKLWPVGG